MSVLNVDAICTDADLQSEAGGLEQLEKAQDDVAIRDQARQQALDECEDALMGRSPPIQPGDLARPLELKRAVTYRALWRIYRDATTVPDSIFDLKSRQMATEFKGAISRSFTVSGTLRGPSGGSVRVERR